MSDEIPENEQPEIIPKPPSHPITTTLLITSFFGVILGIGFIWAELFGSYLVSDKFVDQSMSNHTWSKEKTKQGSIDHYSEDFQGEDKGSEKDRQRIMEYNVKKEIKAGRYPGALEAIGEGGEGAAAQ